MPPTLPAAIAADGYPTGHNSPEAVACDLARAFINTDSALFRSTCVVPMGQGQPAAEYARFLDSTATQMDALKSRDLVATDSPGALRTVYKAQHLSSSAPPQAQAQFGFRDAQFVDVECTLFSGARSVARTLVLLDLQGRWWVLPRPDLYPALSSGLSEEPGISEELVRSKPSPDRPK
jgi:hypothetical protein